MGGTCTSQDWMTCEVDDVQIVHFSGMKPWDLSTHDEITCVAWHHYENNRKRYRILDTAYYRQLATRRSCVFHKEWFSAFEEIDFLQDGFDGEVLSEGVIPERRMAAYL